MINKLSVDYWDRCLYEAGNLFGATRTLSVVNVDKATLQEYAVSAYKSRATTPGPSPYYDDLEHFPLMGNSVLEFGCGAGIDSYFMAKRGARVVACDIVPANVLVARRLLEPEHTVHLLQSYNDLDMLGKFDLVYSHGCLHHIPPEDMLEVIPRLVNCMKAKAYAIIMVYTTTFYPQPNVHPEGPYARGYSVQEFRDLLGPSVLCKSIRIVNQGTFMWGVFCKA